MKERITKIKTMAICQYLFWAYIAFIASFFLLYIIVFDIANTAVFISYAYLLQYMTYLETALLAASFCVSCYYVRMINQKDPSEEIPIVEYIERYVEIGTHMLVVCLLPIGYIVISAFIEKTQLIYVFSTFIVIVGRWVGIILIAHSVSYMCANLMKSCYVYSFVVPLTIVFTCFNEIIINRIPIDEDSKTKVAELLSLNRLFVSGMELDFTGLRINRLFIWKSLTVFFTSLLFLWITVLIKCKGKKQVIIIDAFLAMCIIASAIQYNCVFPKKYDSIEKIFPKKVTRSYYIESYSGEISLNSKSVFKNIVVCLCNPQKEKSIILRLDESFSVKRILCLDSELEFERRGDFLLINLMDYEKENVVLSFDYAGEVSYYSETCNLDIFTEPFSTSLPPRFAFLPTIDDEREAYYSISIKSYNQILSNLKVDKQDNIYSLSGYSNVVCVYSGYFKEITKHEMSIYCAKYNKQTNYDNVFDLYLSLPLKDQYNMVFEESMTDAVPITKIFFIYYFYGTNGFPVKYDDFIIMNYGYIM